MHPYIWSAPQEYWKKTMIYLCDSLKINIQGLENLTELTLSKFDSKPSIDHKFDLYGSQIATIEKSILLHRQNL